MDRIENHPILGETPKRKKVTFSYDGKLLEGYEGADRYSVEGGGGYGASIYGEDT